MYTYADMCTQMNTDDLVLQHLFVYWLHLKKDKKFLSKHPNGSTVVNIWRPEDFFG